MPLSDREIKSFKPMLKDYKESDEKGLYLLVKTSGIRLWRLKYRIDGKEKLLALGSYPEVSLAEAREKRHAARALLRKEIDPIANKRAIAEAKIKSRENSFEVITWEWFSKLDKSKIASNKKTKRQLERDLIPSLGSYPIHEITPSLLLKALQKIEDRGAIETAHRARCCASRIFDYAVRTERANSNPASSLKHALAIPNKTHFSAIIEPKKVGELMRAIENFSCSPPVKAALKLSALFFCRPIEIRRMEWAEVNWEKLQIEIPASKMKLREPHIIPLSTQALEILKDLKLHTGHGKYLFPNFRGASRYMSENTVRNALRSMGFDNDTMTAHGFRAMARTILDEVLRYSPDIIEHQLAHAVRDSNGRSYNRTTHLEDRRKMMQRWADYLGKLRDDFQTVLTQKE